TTLQTIIMDKLTQLKSKHNINLFNTNQFIQNFISIHIVKQLPLGVITEEILAGIIYMLGQCFRVMFK
ncbi:542_t:CDS:1, partial [Dentiscutata heterogama]